MSVWGGWGGEGVGGEVVPAEMPFLLFLTQFDLSAHTAALGAHVSLERKSDAGSERERERERERETVRRRGFRITKEFIDLSPPLSAQQQSSCS